MSAARLVPILMLAGVLAACDDPRTRDVKARLVGTWVAESQEHGGVSRRALVLRADGRVHETVRVIAASGVADVESREGEWFFDGVNLKRKYTQVDGRPLTNARFIYETHELRSVTDAELVAASNVGRGPLHFKREEGAQRR